MTGSLHDIPLRRIDGAADTLASHAGHVLLIVNTASECGLTPQYEGLQTLFERYRDRGFEVLGFPANDFKGQEPGTEKEIAAFCTGHFGVEFPMFAKVTVKGEEKHPLYRALIEAAPEAEFPNGDGFLDRLRSLGLLDEGEKGGIHWNFEKFLLDREGRVVRRFGPDTPPDHPEMIEAIETLLG